MKNRSALLVMLFLCAVFFRNPDVHAGLLEENIYQIPSGSKEVIKEIPSEFAPLQSNPSKSSSKPISLF